jgi:hypothetical protein
MDDELQDVINLNNAIDKAETIVKQMREERRTRLIRLREKKVTARKLSDVLGMSEQNVHKIVKGK